MPGLPSVVRGFSSSSSLPAFAPESSWIVPTGCLGAAAGAGCAGMDCVACATAAAVAAGAGASWAGAAFASLSATPVAAAALGSDFSASSAEVHHRHKRDAPSGTALKLGEALAAGRGEEFQAVYHYDPDGSQREPSAGDIVYSVTRQGENPGEHSVRFASENEILQLSHQVTNRRVFAQGALRAAAWLVGQRAGFYGLRDIVA